MLASSPLFGIIASNGHFYQERRFFVMVPEGWKVLGDYFTSSRAKGLDGLPLMSVTIDRGLIVRSDIDRRTETNLKAEEHLLVEADDIAYNMMRMWQGALGRACADGIVSPAYIVLRAKEGVDSLYAEYLFKTNRYIYYFGAYSYGITSDRLRLYFKDFRRIPARFPPLPEQKKIATILSTWDRAIATTEKLLANSQQQKKALMQQLLTGKTRFPGFTDEWKEVRLGDVCKIKGGNAFKSSEFKDEGVPVLRISNIKSDCSISFEQCVYYSYSKSFARYEVKNGDVVIAMSGATTGKIGKYDFEEFCYLNQRVGRIEVNSNYSDVEFIFQFFLRKKTQYEILIDAIGGAQPNISNSDIEKIKLKIPSLLEQQNIASVLSSADKEIESLQQKTAHLKQEKKALMQQLLTGKRRVKV